MLTSGGEIIRWPRATGTCYPKMGQWGDGAISSKENAASAIGAIRGLLEEIAWGRGSWNEVGRSLVEFLPGSALAVLNFDMIRQAVNTVFATGIDPSFVASFREHYAAVNPWMEFWSTVPPGEVKVSERDSPSSAFRDTEFYTDWLAPQDHMKAASGIRFDVDAHNTVFVCWHYEPRHAPVYDRLAETVLKAAKPGLLDAIRSAAMLRQGLEATPKLGPMIERIDGAALLVDADRHIREANAEASVAMVRGDILTGAGNLLALRDPAAQRWLEEAVAQLSAGKHPGFSTATFAAGERVFRVSVTRAPEYGEPGSPLLIRPRPQLLVVVQLLVGTSLRLDGNGLRLAFGLSGAETRLCEILANGRSLAEAADMLHISEGTARQRIKTIFQKTGTHRQGQLIALVSRFAADP